MSSCEVLQGIISSISAISGATAAYFAFSAIKQNRKNIFLNQRYFLALSVKELHSSFESEWDHFRLSNYSELHKMLLNSEYYVSDKLYQGFLEVIREIKKLDSLLNDQERIDKANEILPMLEDLKLKMRLDE
ncbi:hypothetical protein [Pseudoalteromonas sp. SMN1298-MNA-CIBAN-0114]|uniref:hypothetical protein n=1 Tax=Pseudoalteromonas sp. SMN1298-MNA-CIBAN-0114 TaxID=3140428 RepID=UPI00332D0BF5